MFTEKLTVWLLWPEIALVLLAVWIFVGNALFRPKLNAQTRLGWTTFAVLAVAFAAFALIWHQGGDIWRESLVLPPSGPLLVDYFAYAMRSVALLAGLLLVFQASRAAEAELHCEYLGTLLLAVVGVMLTASAGELVFLFLGLEMISIPTYVLLFLGRRDGPTAEATVKYFFLSLVSSAMLLYGFSFLYGMTGSTSLTEIRLSLETAAAADAENGLMGVAPVALVLIFAGLGFRIAAAPFHFYAPDVYQGATNVNAGFLSVLPKIAGIVVFVRLVGATMPTLGDFAWQMTAVLAILTMTIGNVSALWQSNIRRLMAYSSIAHSGYMLIGLAVALAAGPAAVEQGGLAAMLLYLFVYVVATLGAFAVLAHLGGKDRELDRVDELAGLAKARPVTAGLLAVCMFSLSGIPPLAGFWGKLALFGSAVRLAFGAEDAAVQGWFAVLAVVGVLNAAVAAAYYLRIVGVMFFRPLETAPRSQGGLGPWFSAAAATALVFVLGVLPGRLIDNSRRAEIAVRGQAAPPPVNDVGQALRE